MQKNPEIGGNHQGAMSNYIKITRKRKTGVGKDGLSSVYFIHRKVRPINQKNLRRMRTPCLRNIAADAGCIQA